MTRTLRQRVARLEAHQRHPAPMRETIVGDDGQRWTCIANGLVVPEVADAGDAGDWQAQAVPHQQALEDSQQ